MKIIIRVFQFIFCFALFPLSLLYSTEVESSELVVKEESNAAFEQQILVSSRSSDGRPWADVYAEYLKEAEAGDANAQFRVALLYYHGKATGKENQDKAFDWCYKAADQSHLDGLYRLGRMYYFGNGTPQSFENAILCYRAAANLGNKEAQYQMGSMYGNGLGVKRNFVESYAWSLLSAEQGYEKAVAQCEKMLPGIMSKEEMAEGKRLAGELKLIIAHHIAEAAKK